MAIIDELDENDSQSQEEFSNITDTDTAQKVQETETDNAPEEVKDDIPEKYRGKSVAEIARMHAEAEKLIGKQANEVGELRKLTDEILKQQLASTQPKQQEETEVDFWSDPDTYLNKKLETHPDILAARQLQIQQKMQQTASLLQKNHPDFQQIASSQDFQDWVAKSKVRTELYVRADKDFDYDSADELLTSYKALRGVKQEVAQQQVKDLADNRQKQLKAASVDSGGGNETSRKIYRRSDLIRLKMTDPARYDALQPEIMAAYQEGRVK
jgi:hypothetical protein